MKPNRSFENYPPYLPLLYTIISRIVRITTKSLVIVLACGFGILMYITIVERKVRVLITICGLRYIKIPILLVAEYWTIFLVVSNSTF